MYDSGYKIIIHLMKEFVGENKYYFIGVIIISILIGFIQTNGINTFVAKLIDQTNENEPKSSIWNLFYILSVLYIIYQIFYYIMNELQSHIYHKMRPWIKSKLLDYIMQVNSNIFSEINFASLTIPMGRIADKLSWLTNDIISYVIPDIIFTLVVSFYFFQLDSLLSILFLVGFSISLLYYVYTFNETFQDNKKYEKSFHTVEKSILDILNNIDKVIHRAETYNEGKNIEKLATLNTNDGINYQHNANIINANMHIIIMIVYLTSVGYLIKLVMNKKISHVSFVTSLTLLMVFREKIVGLLEQIPIITGYFGRMENALKNLKHITKNFDEFIVNDKKGEKHKLNFNNIKFENISFSYTDSKNKIISNKTINITPKENTIVGITGPSGSGKSTIMKLLIKMYPLQTGEIYIDGVNVKDIDSFYLRKEVTYISQNSKLFDQKVIENMMYGCMDMEKCSIYLNKVMSYPKIAALYQNMDINKKRAGQLGENLSGGQRQVVNMISGFINPSKILILDEPTNALDPELKKEVIQLIKDFKQYKKNIFIVSHDKDVFQIFDDEIKLGQ
jgi:ABC-type bacteriocin/lantibiotic exporter with double-glycine peptidase domain